MNQSFLERLTASDLHYVVTCSGNVRGFGLELGSEKSLEKINEYIFFLGKSSMCQDLARIDSFHFFSTFSLFFLSISYYLNLANLRIVRLFVVAGHLPMNLSTFFCLYDDFTTFRGVRHSGVR